MQLGERGRTAEIQLILSDIPRHAIPVTLNLTLYVTSCCSIHVSFSKMTYDYSNDNNFLHSLATWYSMIFIVQVHTYQSYHHLLLDTLGRHRGFLLAQFQVSEPSSFGGCNGLALLGVRQCWPGAEPSQGAWYEHRRFEGKGIQKFWRTPKYKKRNELWYSLGSFCEFCEGGMGRHKIQSLSQAGVIHTDHVEQAMLKVDRSNYAPRNAYTDAPQPLGHQAGCGTGRVIICTYMHHL